MTTQYLRIKEKYLHYKGNRYFKFDCNSDTVIQVCINTGTDRGKGRGFYIGIYRISKNTLLQNYHIGTNYDYCEPCTKDVYDRAFKYATDLLNMTTQEIEQYLYGNTCLSKSDTTAVSKALSRLIIQDKINLLESVIEHPTKPGYKRHDVLDKIKQLKKELKELQ